MGAVDMTLEQRFWSKVNKQGPYPHKKACEVWPDIKGTRCWEWTGSLYASGYGQFRNKVCHILSHRFAYELEHSKGSLGKKLCCHKCDNPKCVRWSHLFKGTNKDNGYDKKIKDRANKIVDWNLGDRQGEACSNSILTNDSVLKIRRMYASGKYFQKDLALRFRVHPATISHIIQGRSWSHI
jgi:Autographiviridae endonuclease